MPVSKMHLSCMEVKHENETILKSKTEVRSNSMPRTSPSTKVSGAGDKPESRRLLRGRYNARGSMPDTI